MPRIRTIKPEFWEDEKFSGLSIPALLVYIGMKNFADDQGVITSNSTVIRNKVFPAREDIRTKQVSEWLKELSENSVIIPFEHDSKGYYMMDFSSERIDKPQKSEIPDDVLEKLRNGNIREHSGTFANVLSGEERKVKESKGEEGEGIDPPPPKFLKFQEWIDKNAKRVGEMKETFTQDQYERIMLDYPRPTVLDILKEMHNYGELFKKNVSAYHTADKWCKKRVNEEREQREKSLGNSGGASANERKYGSTGAAKNTIFAEAAELDSNLSQADCPYGDGTP